MIVRLWRRVRRLIKYSMILNDTGRVRVIIEINIVSVAIYIYYIVLYLYTFLISILISTFYIKHTIHICIINLMYKYYNHRI